MSDYIQDPNNSKKQVPGKLPDNARDRISNPRAGTFTKTPNAVVIGETMTTGIKFYFKSSASFASDVGGNGATVLTGASASLYQNFGKPTAGTTLNIHPTAVSCSDALSGSVAFVYKSGLSTGGF